MWVWGLSIVKGGCIVRGDGVLCRAVVGWAGWCGAPPLTARFRPMLEVSPLTPTPQTILLPEGFLPIDTPPLTRLPPTDTRRLQKEKRGLDVRVAEERGRLSAELELLRVEGVAAEARLVEARAEAVRLEGELRDYKARAHALLNSKEVELQAAKDVAREESAAALEGAEARAAAAERELHLAEAELAEVQASAGAELAALTKRYEGQLAELRQASGEASDTSQATKRWGFVSGGGGGGGGRGVGRGWWWWWWWCGCGGAGAEGLQRCLL